jgi:anti-anti-sigma factor
MAVEMHRADRPHDSLLRGGPVPITNAAEHTVPTSSSEPDFSVETYRRNGRQVVVVRGILDESSVGEFRRAFVQALNEPERLVIVDVSEVPLIDSDGFGALIIIQKRLTEMNKSLALAGCQEAVRLALSLTRLEVLFPTYPDVESVPLDRR